MDVQKTGELIARRRKEQGLTQKELARKLHVSDRAVSKWERGINLPSAEQFEPLCEALGLTVLELLRGEPSPEENIPVVQAEEAVSAVAELALYKERRVRRLRFLGILLTCALLLCGGLLIHDRYEQAERQAKYDNEYSFPRVRISHYNSSGKTIILENYPSALCDPDMPYGLGAAIADLAINTPINKMNEHLELRDVPVMDVDDWRYSDPLHCYFTVNKPKTNMNIKIYRWPPSLQGTGVSFEDGEDIPYEPDPTFHGEDGRFQVEVGYSYSVVVFWGENDQYFAEYAFRTTSYYDH